MTARFQHTVTMTLQELANSLSTDPQSFGLTISLQKTEMMFQPAPGHTIPSPAIVIAGTKLRNAEAFTYFSSCLSAVSRKDKEISNRLAMAGGSFGRL